MPAFKRVLESGLTMIAVHPIINTKLNRKDYLPLTTGLVQIREEQM